MKHYTADFLLDLIIPGSIPLSHGGDCCDVSFHGRDGWMVNVFYDVGELDYINHFTDPQGREINFWDWPDSPDRQRLICWRGDA